MTRAPGTLHPGDASLPPRDEQGPSREDPRLEMARSASWGVSPVMSRARLRTREPGAAAPGPGHPKDGELLGDEGLGSRFSLAEDRPLPIASRRVPDGNCLRAVLSVAPRVASPSELVLPRPQYVADEQHGFRGGATCSPHHDEDLVPREVDSISGPRY